jgi:hypothetical protein
MSYDHHIIALSLTHWANLPRPKATGCDLHNAAQKFDGPDVFPGINENEPHPF